MDLYSSISRRKSCRKFVTEPLGEKRLEEIRAFISKLQLLYPDSPLEYRFATETKGMFHVIAPHYLVISGQGRDGEQENAGFIGQQLMLWLNANELGGVWLGATRDASGAHSRSDIIVLAFGKPEGSPHRGMNEFKRKDISETTNAPDDECIKAAHLAPSGLNKQPWFFEQVGHKLLVYRQLLKPPISLAYRLTRVDMGIALCHYAIACKHFGKPFHFQGGGNAEAKKGYEFMGYVDSTIPPTLPVDAPAEDA